MLCYDKYMIIAVDDAGDPGFKLGTGSSRYFLIAAVCFDDDLDAEEMSLRIKRLRRDLKWKPLHEFKFRKTSPEIRKKFLDVVKNYTFSVSLVILDKSQIDGNALRNNASRLYNTAILKAIKGLNTEIKNAHIYIDGESGRNYRKNVKTFFRKELPKGSIKELTYRDSRNDNLIQLADMIVGAIRRSVEKDRDGSYHKILKKRIIRVQTSI